MFYVCSVTDVDAHIEPLNDLTQGARRLASRYLVLADRDDGPEDREAARLYLDCFKAYRIGVGLVLRLLDPPKAPRAEADAEPADRDIDREPRDDDRDRDRDEERVSLPAFLKTLGVVARKMEARGDFPAEVATIKQHLAEAKPTPGVTALTRPAPKPAANARARLLGSTAKPPPKLNTS
jgi:hypothetical protein